MRAFLEKKKKEPGKCSSKLFSLSDRLTDLLDRNAQVHYSRISLTSTQLMLFNPFHHLFILIVAQLTAAGEKNIHSFKLTSIFEYVLSAASIYENCKSFARNLGNVLWFVFFLLGFSIT